MTAAASEPDWDALRQRFPVLQQKTYLNSCSYGALAIDVRKGFDLYLDDRMTNGANWEYWVERNEAVRSSTARLLGAHADEIAVTASASAGISSLASALDFGGARNKVVISDLEFPTNAQIWYAQQSRGAKVERVAETDGEIAPGLFEQAIDDQTLIVALSHICYRNGFKQDIASIVEIARARGALVMIDGYQAVGSMDYDVKQLDLDFLAGGFAKYLLGTAGIGYFYVRQSLVESLSPTMTGWFADEDIFAMSVERYAPSKTARRFEMGTPPVPNTYAAEAGLDIIHQAGPAAIEQRNLELANQLYQMALDAGYQIASPADPARRGAMVAIASTDEHELVRRLHSEHQIVTSCRDGNLRVSPHFYNNQGDLETLFAALDKCPNLLRRRS